ncbi:MAG: hypothetical protein R2809_00500 [Flavobacteriales bacterium]
MKTLSNFNPHQTYTAKAAQFAASTARMKSVINRLAMMRLGGALITILGIYLLVKNDEKSYWGLIILGVIVFSIAMKWQWMLNRKYSIEKLLLEINERELKFLEGNNHLFDGGEEFKDAHHSYSFDLDIFGKNSLYAHINRTHTRFGRNHLAQALLRTKSKEQILAYQKAVAEVCPNIDFRQNAEAHSLAVNDTINRHKLLMDWIAQPKEHVSKGLRYTAFALTGLFVLCIALSFISAGFPFGKLAAVIFVLQLALSASKIKSIISEVSYFEKIKDELFHYKNYIEIIENASFENNVLKDIQSQLKAENGNASTKIKTLSSIIDNISTVQNLVAFSFFSGMFCFHLHQYFRLLQWKEQHGKALPQWFGALGNWEVIHSFAQLKYNFSEYQFPEITDEQVLEFKDLGHPLIRTDKRVVNDIDYKAFQFVLLTGSNMSGKSTFLRTVGINMILANAGSAVCASHAKLFPYHILVSMRLDDSLADSQSYFFAEINRLKMIVEEFPTKPSFIILDEILRGTNSDDKRLGTIELLKI